MKCQILFSGISKKNSINLSSAEFAQRVVKVRIYSLKTLPFPLPCLSLLTLKAPRKSASENVVCLCRLLHLLANFSNLHFAYRQTVWTQIRLLLKGQSDLGPHCLQK